MERMLSRITRLFAQHASILAILFVVAYVLTAMPVALGDDDDERDERARDEVRISSHVNRYTTYEGSKTCLGCHAGQVHDAHQALHYQWRGPTPYVPGLTEGGKLGAINDFCGYPDINFIGQLTNLDGQTVDGGCAICHAGMGQKPSPVQTQVQLENIDCLVCHSDSYRRKVVRQPDGSFRFEPAPERMTVPLLQAITAISRQPTRGSCVNCHAYAGGGCNNKRGDMEEAHRNPPTRAFDVHMASTSVGGAGLLCTSCHTTSEHRIAGRGVDLRATDLDRPVRCTNCHSGRPHGSADLNRHTARVDCSVCHIPFFAKIATTDMLRDFSLPPEVEPTRRLYEPHIARAGMVVPEYRFFNGLSEFYHFATPAMTGPSGRVLMAGPLGDITDRAAKIYPFKHHLAVLPVDLATHYIVPVKAGILFQTGNMDAAIRQGASEVGWPLSAGYGFIAAERYMGIFHEVSPKGEALRCNACHFGGARLDFATLGYTPKATRNGRPLCASCHRDESDEWNADKLFREVHHKHVQDERIACTECHNG
jgi:hypothetical protein